MLVGGEQPTPLDLRFRLGPFPVRVSPWFWLIMAFLGEWVFRSPKYGPIYLLFWVLCGFVSILIHELGHAVAFRVFGSRASITLHGFGGYAETHSPPSAAWQRLTVAFAGPAIGLALAGLAFVVGWYALPEDAHPYLTASVNFLFFMNLFWNLLNLLPVWPLDGGKICRELLAMFRVRRADEITHTLSIIVAGALAVFSAARVLNLIPANVLLQLPSWVLWLPAGMLTTIWLALFAYENYQMLQLLKRHRPRYFDDDSDTPPWRR